MKIYATIPEDEAKAAKQPKNQAPGPVRRGYGLVVAVCVGVIIGTLGTIAFVGGPEAPSRAAMELDQDLVEDCKAARESWERDRESWKIYCGIVLEDK